MIDKLMSRLDMAEERNNELENKAREIIQDKTKEIKTWKIWKKIYKMWKTE